MKGKFLFSIILLITTITNYCQAQKLSKPESNFEFFWQTFDKNYIGFKVRKVDWRQQYIKYRPLVTQNTTGDELFNILNQMVEPLKDGHVVISKTGDLPASAKYSDFHKQFPTKDSVKLLRNVIIRTYPNKAFPIL